MYIFDTFSKYLFLGFKVHYVHFRAFFVKKFFLVMHKIPVTNNIVILQMQNSLLDLLRSSLIPELQFRYIRRYVLQHSCILGAVPARWTLP